MVSVCMATQNGAKFVAQQLDSILHQLSSTDEIVITDDGSTDETVAIVRGYDDPRIILSLNSSPRGIARTFEASLLRASGEYIFLADQDDLWLPQKVSVMKDHLANHDLVVSDCMLVDHHLNSRNGSFFRMNRSGRGLLRNLIRNSYMGCCMAFRRKVLEKALPFPADIPIHDYWIGLIGEMYFDVRFIPDVLIYHRRHAGNASTNGGRSHLAFSQKFLQRYRIIKNLILRKSYAA